MNAFIEKLAIASFEVHANRARIKVTPWGGQDDNTRDEYRAAARATIQAMMEPSKEMWGGLARDIVMWTRFTGIPTGEGLHKHLRSIRPDPIPEWLTKEIPDTNQTPPKGTVAACIYKAMLEAALQ